MHRWLESLALLGGATLCGLGESFSFRRSLRPPGLHPLAAASWLHIIALPLGLACMIVIGA